MHGTFLNVDCRTNSTVHQANPFWECSKYPEMKKDQDLNRVGGGIQAVCLLLAFHHPACHPVSPSKPSSGIHSMTWESPSISEGGEPWDELPLDEQPCLNVVPVMSMGIATWQGHSHRLSMDPNLMTWPKYDQTCPSLAETGSPCPHPLGSPQGHLYGKKLSS